VFDPAACVDLCESVEVYKRLRFTVLEDGARAGNPIGPLAVDEVSDDVERAPRVLALVRLHPAFR